MPTRIVAAILVRVFVSCVVLGACVAPVHAQTAITACEQVVQGAAYLTGDLDCPPGTEAAVEIRSGGSLDMRGFAIHGGEYGVLCSAEGVLEGDVEVYDYTGCKVFGGGGTISGQSVVGIVASRLLVSDLTIDVPSMIGLIIHSKLKLSNLTLQLGPNTLGVMIGDHVKVGGTGFTMIGGHDGIAGPGVVTLDGVTASGYDRFAAYVRSVKLRHASLVGITRGMVDVGAVTLRDSTMTGHSGTAIEAGRIRLTDSTVTGNGLDLDADRSPKLKNSTCGTSNGWGVCTND
jgi:hypothetical protein